MLSNVLALQNHAIFQTIPKKAQKGTVINDQL